MQDVTIMTNGACLSSPLPPPRPAVNNKHALSNSGHYSMSASSHDTTIQAEVEMDEIRKQLTVLVSS